MRWQFEVEEGADESVAGRIVWTVDYEKNGLSRNSYFPPQDSRISAKITILGEHPESIVTVFKVSSACQCVCVCVCMCMCACVLGHNCVSNLTIF